MPEKLCREKSLVLRLQEVKNIIELKRPNIKITRDELNQITDYVDFIKKRYRKNVTEVKGFLISNNMEMDSNVELTRKALESQNIYVKSYSDLLAEARRYNNELYTLYDEIADAKTRKNDCVNN